MSIATYDNLPKVLQVLERLCQGHTLTAACQMERITSVQFKRFVASDVNLQAAFEDAEQRGYDTMADLLLNPFDNLIFGDTDVKKIKIICENIKWYLSRKRPTQYGDKSVVEHQITADRAIIDAMQAGKQRVIDNVITDVTYHIVEKETQPVKAALPPELLQFVQ